MDGVRISVSGSKSTEDSRFPLYTVLVNSFRRAALQCEVAVCRLYECVLAQAVEGVLEAVQCADVWVAVEPTYSIQPSNKDMQDLITKIIVCLQTFVCVQSNSN